MHGRGRSRKPQMGADAGLRQVEGGMPAVHESSSCPSRQLHSPGSASSGSMLRTHARTSWRQTPAAAVPPPRRPAPPHQSALHRQTHSTAQHSTAQHSMHSREGARSAPTQAWYLPNQCGAGAAASTRTAVTWAGRQGSTPVWKGALLADCWNTLRCSRAGRRGQRQGGCVSARAAGCGASAAQEQGHTHLACMHSWQQQQHQ